jgi:TolB-like protein
MIVFPEVNRGNRVRIRPPYSPAEILRLRIVVLAWMFLWASCPTSRAQEAFDAPMAQITDKIAEAIKTANLKAVTVAEFTEPRDKQSDLGAFFADQLSTGLIQRQCSVVDRQHFADILAEHKVTMSGLVDPETAKKMGQFAGVDAIVIGTITSLGGTIRLTVKVISTESAKFLAAASRDLPKTAWIRQTLGEVVPESTPEPVATPQAMRNEFVQRQAPIDSDEVRRAEPLTAPESPPPASSQRGDNPAALIIALNRAFDNHDWQTVTEGTVDGSVNYFGHSRASNDYIRKDMQGDARTYQSVRSTVYPETFTHEVSGEYSPRWSGPMIYDSINVYSEILENGGRLHKALTRLTMGYTLQDDQKVRIYALVLKVL